MSVYPGGRLGPAGLRPTVSEWTVSDFKALDYVSLPLAPLNVLAGANSSGKSSLIQSLLLLAQSTDEEIILNGPLVRLGEPRDVIRSGRSRLSLGYTTNQRIRGEADTHEYAFRVALAADSGTFRVAEFSAAADGNTVVFATNERVTASARALVNPQDRFGDALLRVREIGDKQAPARTYLAFRGLYPEVVLYRRTRKQVQSLLRRQFRPAALKSDPDLAVLLVEEMSTWLRSDKGREQAPQSLELSLDRGTEGGTRPAKAMQDLRPNDLEGLYRNYANSIPIEDWVPVPFGRYSTSLYWRSWLLHSSQTTMLGVDPSHQFVWRTMGVAVDALRSLHESVRYLGPLREEPQVVSATGGRYRSLPAGPKGEFTADLLARSKNHAIPFRDWHGKERSEKIPEAVSLWTTYLGVGDAVTVEDQGKLGRGLRIRVNGVERDLTTIGVGASQVLPVLTLVLAADRGALVLLEQPELHLHPAVQSRLADFFLWARPDLRIIVETHSEYLVTRLRLRVAEGTADAGKIAILFAEQTDGVSQFRRLDLNSLGDLSEWPDGFFDTQDNESRALVRAVHASLAKKK